MPIHRLLVTLLALLGSLPVSAADATATSASTARIEVLQQRFSPLGDQCACTSAIHAASASSISALTSVSLRPVRAGT
jgi:hypothetical protein